MLPKLGGTRWPLLPACLQPLHLDGAHWGSRPGHLLPQVFPKNNPICDYVMVKAIELLVGGPRVFKNGLKFTPPLL